MLSETSNQFYTLQPRRLSPGDKPPAAAPLANLWLSVGLGQGALRWHVYSSHELNATVLT